MYSPLQFSSSLGSVLQYRVEFHPLFLHQHQILFFYSPSQKKIKSHPSFNFLNVYREKRESRKIKRRISKYSLLSKFDIRLLSPSLSSLQVSKTSSPRIESNRKTEISHVSSVHNAFPRVKWYIFIRFRYRRYPEGLSGCNPAV